MNSVQREIEAKGREIFDRMAGRDAAAFSKRKLAGRLIGWSMRDEGLKTRLFRLVDVLPSLTTANEVARHASEYLGDNAASLPPVMRWAANLAPRLPRLTAYAARRGVERMARTFILARNAPEALPRLLDMRRLPIGFTADILGETAVSEAEAGHYQLRYLELVECLAAAARAWTPVNQIDTDDRGPIPRVNVSVKVSALYSQIHPTAPEDAIAVLSARLRPLLYRAKELDVFINFDMEGTHLKELTLELFKRLLDDPALRDYDHAGIALQAYLRDSDADLDGLVRWARKQNRRITIRLIKGAYWDTEVIQARQRGWPVPVFEQKHETDARFEQLAGRMLAEPGHVNSAFGTHNVRSIANCLVQAARLGRPVNSLEIQMLHGMAEPIKEALAGMGCRVRDYCPIGEVLPGMSYLVRRLLENSSNEGFLRSAFSEHQQHGELLRDPANIESSPPPAPAMPFDNEPHTDFAIATNRAAMRAALKAVRSEFGREYTLRIGDKPVWPGAVTLSLNPACPTEIIGRVAKAGIPEVEAAVRGARAAFPGWRATPVEKRAQLLERAAELMRGDRFRMAALEVFETGKNWGESDADVCEAIDFCRFYAREMRRIAEEHYPVPGEHNVHQQVPRGVVAVIAPWNFPLAILCGMTVAALVAGNCVIMKPSAQSSVVGAWFMDVLRRAGTPPGTVQYLPGPGREVGEHLVRHPHVDVIAFTGSREVGLNIWEEAGRTRPGQLQMKKVVCEMGGKNAIILDSGADLDEAIPAVLHSAFGYSGQKCSALSRLIVLQGNYDRALDRLVKGARSLRIGPAEDPGTLIGPLIDAAAVEKVRQYIEVGKHEATLIFQGTTPADGGFYVPPVIFSNVPASARIAQEEIFGPVLSVLRARNLDEAFEWANQTPYALTGGFFSRSPANIRRACVKMDVGNLYINRGITGALVARQPFGGFRMSGGGTKAGGRDYLKHFLFPRVVTENLMRRGFAPGTGGDDDRVS